MIHRFRSTVRTDREGATLAVVAVMIVALLGLMAFGIDLGMAYTARAEAQRVADSAALAGASIFLDFTDPINAVQGAEDEAREYAERNMVQGRMVQADPPEVMVWVDPSVMTVRVRVERTGLPVWFARFLGQSELTVSAMATAQASNAGSSTCVKPFAIPDRWEDNSGDDVNGNNIMDFDKVIPCAGQGPNQGCQNNEVWTFDPEAGDVYRPANNVKGETIVYGPEQATSWGSKWLDPTNRDAGARILISPQYALQSGDPGWYQYWQMPDSEATCSSKGTQCLTENIKSCINLGDLGIGDTIGHDPDLFDSEQDPIPGNRGKPVFDAIQEVIKQDPDIRWNETTNEPYYPDGRPNSIFESARVITVLLVHPADIRSGASHTMRIADMATMFLEDPLEVYGNQGTNHHKPITGRLLHYGSGLPGPNAGQLQRFLRLIE